MVSSGNTSVVSTHHYTTQSPPFLHEKFQLGGGGVFWASLEMNYVRKLGLEFFGGGVGWVGGYSGLSVGKVASLFWHTSVYIWW